MIEVLKQALEALELLVEERSSEAMDDGYKAITSLRQAIAELESQEPVAWSYWQSCLNDDGTQTAPWVHRLSKFKPHESIINKDVVPLYTHPPQRTEQKSVAHCEAGPEFCPVCRAETRSLALAAAVGNTQRNTPTLVWTEICNALTTTPPAQPPQRKPLTEREILDFWLARFNVEGSPINNFVRAIEAAHGIKE